MSTQGKQIGATVGSVGGGVVGSAFGPVGTVVGSTLGGLAGGLVGGLFGGEDSAPQLPHIDPAIANSTLPESIKRKLYLQSLGIDETNPANLQLNNQLNANVASGASQAASARGVNAGLAYRAGTQQTANSNLQAIGNNQVVNAAQQQASLQQYLANEEADRQARIQVAGLQSGVNVAAANMESNKNAQDNAFLGGLLNTAGTLGGAYLSSQKGAGATPSGSSYTYQSPLDGTNYSSYSSPVNSSIYQNQNYGGSSLGSTYGAKVTPSKYNYGY